jgi:dihydrodipicolinate synthase/N-acetylneuraminate lyase
MAESLHGTWYISPTPFTDAGGVDTAGLTTVVEAATLELS